MEVFIWMFIALVMLWILEWIVPGRAGRNIVWLCGFLVLWLILALRDIHVGNDLKFYIPTFLHGNGSARFEFGYQALSDFVRQFTNNGNVFLALTSFISVLPISFLYRHFSKSISLSYIIYAGFILYHFSFSGLRQAIAMGFVAISYFFIVRKQLIPFIAIIFVAASFHSSAIIFVLMYPFCNWINLTNKRYWLLSMIAFGVILAMKPILGYLLPILFEDGKYQHYIEHENMPAFNLFALFILLFLSTFAVKTPSPALRNYRAALFLCALGQSLGFISQAATRITYYFLLFLPLALPQIIYEMKINKGEKAIASAVVITFMILFFYYFNSGGYLRVVPYSFYWE